MSIQLITLGPPRCIIDAEPTDLAAQKLRFALLLYLAIQKRAPRESVAALFWPERDEEKARHTLSQNIYELRKLLGEDWIKPQADPLEINDVVHVDAIEFEQLVKAGQHEKALALYHGDFLAGFHIKGSNEFDSWIENKRRELKRLHHRAYREHIGALITAGNLTQALAQSQRWVSLDPIDDEANHTLIDVLAHNARRGEAIAHYEKYEKRLRVELDVAPLDETRELVARIRERTNGRTAVAAANTPVDSRPHFREHAPHAAVANENWWTQIKQSQVARVGAVYTATTFLVVQFADVMVPSLQLPDVIIKIVAVLAVLGLPVALGMAWAFAPNEMPYVTSDGAALSRFTVSAAARKWAVGVLAVLVIAGGAFATIRLTAPPPATEPYNYVIAPFTYGDGVKAPSTPPEQMVQEGVLQWGGVNVVDWREVRAEVAANRERVDVDALARFALQRRASKLIVGDITRVGAQYQLSGALFDISETRRPLRRVTIRVPVTASLNPATYVAFVRRLLVGRPDSLDATTKSLPAVDAYHVGLQAVQTWQLERAAEAFARALRIDGEFTGAHLWLAQVRSWLQQPAATWRMHAQHALTDSAMLPAHARMRAVALNALAEGDHRRACAEFRALAEKEPHDFSTWYGLADCLSNDHLVVSEAQSPTGYAFRSSYHAAVKAYQRAFQLLPAIHMAFSADSYARMRALILTSRSNLRFGKSADGTDFVAYPSWQGDTLALHPFKASSIMEPKPWLRSEVIEKAIREQRTVFHDIAGAWLAAQPGNPDALEAMSVSLELLGDRSALDSLARARAMAPPREKARLASAEVLLRVKFVSVDDSVEMRRIKLLCDSLLENSTADESASLASVAALTGRITQAARLSRDTRNFDVPESFKYEALRLRIFAAAGGPADSIDFLTRRITSALTNTVVESDQPRYKSNAFGQAVLLAAHERAFPVDADMAKTNALIRAAIAVRNGDLAAARGAVVAWQNTRSNVRPADRSIDGVFIEAVLLAKLGDNSRATALLEEAFGAMQWSPPQALQNPVRSIALVRAFALQAELERSRNPRQSSRYAKAVLMLWSDADPSLRPIVLRMKELARPS